MHSLFLNTFEGIRDTNEAIGAHTLATQSSVLPDGATYATQFAENHPPRYEADISDPLIIVGIVGAAAVIGVVTKINQRK